MIHGTRETFVLQRTAEEFIFTNPEKQAWAIQTTRSRQRSAPLAQLDAAVPLRRMARPEEIASVVGFVAGDGASYVTATTIFADGGIVHSSVRL